ncbi:MAG: GerMN domain-containing protein [Candidatus Hydrogenedentes bacterium]|jgi:spore germination protein GerM|nr:GerMN domain-containing protein [Candidatus Hydrogenedentota bacterium]
MKSTKKRYILRRFGLLTWGWITLLLCFILVLLINQMLSQGQNPLTSLTEGADELPEQSGHVQNTQESFGTREVTVFYASEQGHVLATETAVIEYSAQTVENCRRTLAHLIAGPKQSFLLPLLPEQTRVRGLYLQANGELVIDLSTELLLAHNCPRSAEMEALMAFGIVNTMMQPELTGEDGIAVKQVRFLFDGSAPQELFPAHLDLNDPLVQDKRWVQAGYQ